MSVILSEISQEYKQYYKENKVILSFSEYLELVRNEPIKFCRSSPEYLLDCFEFYGVQEKEDGPRRFKIFDLDNSDTQGIIGGEKYQNEIFQLLKNFKRNKSANKMIVLHGPNGSAKSSSINAIAHGLQNYSLHPEGAIYKFNWVFPADKNLTAGMSGQNSKIGFGSYNAEMGQVKDSYAYLGESEISAKISSNFKENPLFLIPLNIRHKFFDAENPIPQHMMLDGLSKRNQTIFEQLLHVYSGDLSKVFKHVQVERFYFSKKYRNGIAIVEPQMPVDANERQLTMDRGINNLPAILQNYSFFEAGGHLVDANLSLIHI